MRSILLSRSRLMCVHMYRSKAEFLAILEQIRTSRFTISPSRQRLITSSSSHGVVTANSGKNGGHRDPESGMSLPFQGHLRRCNASVTHCARRRWFGCVSRVGPEIASHVCSQAPGLVGSTRPPVTTPGLREDISQLQLPPRLALFMAVLVFHRNNLKRWLVI